MASRPCSIFKPGGRSGNKVTNAVDPQLPLQCRMPSSYAQLVMLVSV